MLRARKEGIAQDCDALRREATIRIFNGQHRDEASFDQLPFLGELIDHPANVLLALVLAHQAAIRSKNFACALLICLANSTTAASPSLSAILSNTGKPL